MHSLRDSFAKITFAHSSAVRQAQCACLESIKMANGTQIGQAPAPLAAHQDRFGFA